MTLYAYIARHYLMWFFIILLALLGIIFMFDTIELLRRTADNKEITFDIILIMSTLGLPDMVQKTMPFVALFAAMLTLWHLTRNQELIIVRAVGVSAWEFLLPMLVTTVMLSLFYLFVINPLGTLMKKAYLDLENKYIDHNVMMDLSSAGLWLRQSNENANYLLHADAVTPEPFTLKPLIAFIYDKNGTYKGRIDAQQAVLADKKWVISNAWENMRDGTMQKIDETTLPTQFSTEKIQESMLPPSTVSFWDLPGFITALESTGFPGIRHRLQLYSLIIQPVFLCAMVLFAACFSMGMTRRGGAFTAALSALFVGSFAFSLNDMVQAMGVSQALPTWVAAFAIPIIAVSSGATALFHLEDG